MERDELGFPKAGPPPVDELLKQTNAIADRLREQAHVLTEMLVSIIENAAGVPEEKQFGCERCSDCTLRISQTLERALASAAPPLELIFVNIPKFAGFPRALAVLLRKALSAATASAETGVVELVANQLLKLCGMASESFNKRRFLPFSRIAAVLELLRPEIEAALTKCEGAQSLFVKLEALRGQTDQVVAFLPSDSFLDLPSETGMRKRHKRICGGGYIQKMAIGIEPKSEPLFVVDFSESYVLAIVTKPCSDPLRDCMFLPCKRELPFRAHAVPARRGDGNAAMEVTSESLKPCGRYYQLFEIHVEPRYSYYYRALCAAATTKHPVASDARFVNTFDWPAVSDI